MADEGAWQAGWQQGRELSQERRAHKQALSDAELQGKITDLISKRQSLVEKIPTLKGTLDYEPALKELQGVETGLREVYHPNNNPTAIQKFGHLLTDHLGIKVKDSNAEGLGIKEKESLSDYRRGKAYDKNQNALAGDLKKAEEDISAGPLTPEQQAGADARSTLAKFNADIENHKAMNPHAYGPDATPEEKKSVIDYRNELIQKYSGLSEKPNLKPYTLTDGTKAWVDASRPDLIPPGATASVTETPNSLQITQYNDDVKSGKFKGTYPQWLKQQKSGTGLKYESSTGQVFDPVSGNRYSEGDPDNPPKVSKLFKSIGDMTAKKQAFQMKLASIRGAQYNMTKSGHYLDTANGNAPVDLPFGEYLKNPTRYLPAGEADKALAKENQMADISGTSNLTRQAIVGMKEDFPEDMKVKIVLAMRADDPHAALDQLIASEEVGSLTPDQQDFLIATRQLAENAMAMRSILGAGQGSEDMRNAIRDTLPGLLSPNKMYALKQLDAFDKTIARLHRGVPKVPLRTDIGDGTNTPSSTGGASPQQSKGLVSVADAMKKPWNKGKTKEQVKQHIIEKGFTPVE